MKANISAVIDW